MNAKVLPTKRMVDRALISMLGSEKLVENWWTSANLNFKLERPIDVWEKDDDGKISVAHYVLSFLQK